MRPLLFKPLRGALASLRYDIVAGATLAAIAIPEQMATSQLGGFPPHVGFVAFIAGSTAFAIFGASRTLSAGADSTITPIFAGALAALSSIGSPHYTALAAALALLVGALLIVGAVMRAGWVADLLSVPVTTGFLAGVAFHIALSQAPSLLGVGAPAHGPVLARLQEIVTALPHANLFALGFGLFSFATIWVFEKISPRVPGALIALAVTTLANWRFDLSRTHRLEPLGRVSAALPQLAVPTVTFEEVTRIGALAALIAIIVMVQTSAVSRSFPPRDGSSPDIDRDFFGLGVGSVLAGFCGAFPVNASPPRTAIVNETGGRSQAAGLVAALVIAAVAAFGGAALANIPKAALAGVLLFVAARIFRVSVMADILRKTRAEFALAAITMLVVVALPIQLGVALAIILSLIHGAWTTTRTRLIPFDRLPGTSVWWPVSPSMRGETLEGVLVLAYQAPLSFLNAYQLASDLDRALDETVPPPRLVVLEASAVAEIDYTAARVLSDAIASCRSRGVDFAIARLESLRAQKAASDFGLLAELGESRLFRSVDEATRALAPAARTRSEV